MKVINKSIYAITLAINCFFCHANGELLESQAITNTQFELTQVKFTQAQVQQSIEEIIEVLNNEYIYPEKVEVLVKELRKIKNKQAIQYINNKADFMRDIGALLRRTSRDGYIDLLPVQRALVIGDNLEYQYQQQKSNFAFEQARVLENNIGYLKINHFFQNKEAESVAENAFNLLKGTKAVIIDLREASEGSIEFAQYLMSYFIESKTLLCQMIYQRQEKQHEIWSISDIGDREFKRDYPVFILTSSFVTSAAEFFSYTLKHLNKAVIIGEKTMGVAKWSQEISVNEWLKIKLPVAIPVSPITQSNWEGEGVVPDYETDADSSFALALKLAKASIH